MTALALYQSRVAQARGHVTGLAPAALKAQLAYPSLYDKLRALLLCEQSF